jgi:uncharacterized protein
VTTVYTTNQRTRALLLLIVSILYIYAVEIFSSYVTLPLAGSNWFFLVYEALQLALLLAGFVLLIRLQPRSAEPAFYRETRRALGWRPDDETKFQLAAGAAVGWGIALALVLPMVLVGGLQIYFDRSAAAWSALALTIVATALGAAVRQTILAGFPFQRLVDAGGPVVATIAMALFAAMTQSQDLRGNAVALLTVFLLQILFCVAALRTGSLWLGWALDVAARLSVGAVFGLAVAGSGKYASVILSNSRAPEWLSGGTYGPAASMLAPLVVLAAIYAVVRVTRVDVIAKIRPGGIPLDLEARHAPSYPAAPAGEAVVAPVAGVSLVQILPVAAAPAPINSPGPGADDNSST